MSLLILVLLLFHHLVLMELSYIIGESSRYSSNKTHPPAHRTRPPAHRTRPPALRTRPPVLRTHPLAHRTHPSVLRTRPLAPPLSLCSPTPATDRKLCSDEMYLVDSGAQYWDGTTDVTRTVHFGSPTQFQRVKPFNYEL